LLQSPYGTTFRAFQVFRGAWRAKTTFRCRIVFWKGPPLHVNGAYSFKADRQAVYDLMMSQDALAHCLPGCENMEEIGEDAYRATLKIGIAGIKGTYTCTIRTTEKVPLETWTLTIEGQAKTGNVKGVGRFSLADAEGGTELTYDGDADIMGPLAGIGQRMMAPASRTIIGKFFECMSGQLSESSNQS
jgi:uncharacterized protein